MAFRIVGKTILNESFGNDVVNAVWDNLASWKPDPADLPYGLAMDLLG